jgi:hypothetical protein
MLNLWQSENVPSSVALWDGFARITRINIGDICAVSGSLQKSRVCEKDAESIFVNPLVGPARKNETGG